ncbi:hypothetical protein [Mycobacterium malmoense]|uniref:hypothetical protein n=1 Tax=Mycobacterium malmoense TaxID=1780 RepID=UPI00111BF256|nr:hypothetical protein [Mycobacterium malmoense]UNB94428.1 hypothetical protein H5T25_24355 [Mycobacterium malmoense]
MDLAARPHITAGVALASAAVLAAGPMAQHLPDLHVAQHLRQVSVSDIQLTDASSGMVDLFAGVENELASLASGASAAAVPALPAPPTGLPLPIQTWVNAFATAGTNLQTILGNWSTLPAPVLQQVVANWLDYTGIYLGSYLNTGTKFITAYAGNSSTDFFPELQTAFSNIVSGNIATATTHIAFAFYGDPFNALSNLENIPPILGNMTTNLNGATEYLTNGAIRTLGEFALSAPQQWFGKAGLGNALQLVYNSWTAGNPLGTLTTLANIPGAVANTIINGIPPAYTADGFLSVSPNFAGGLLEDLAIFMPRQLAPAIVAPGAVNISEGGTLGDAFQMLSSTLSQDFTSLLAAAGSAQQTLPAVVQSLFDTVLAYFNSSLGAGGAAAFAPSVAASTWSAELPGLSADVLKAFNPAAVTNLVGSLGPSMAAHLAASLGPSMLGNLGGALAGQIGSWIAALLRLL